MAHAQWAQVTAWAAVVGGPCLRHALTGGLEHVHVGTVSDSGRPPASRRHVRPEGHHPVWPSPAWPVRRAQHPVWEQRQRGGWQQVCVPLCPLLAAAAHPCRLWLLHAPLLTSDVCGVVVERRTRRSWKPNAMRKRVFSDLLGRMVPIYLTAHTLRCIDKAGGASPWPGAVWLGAAVRAWTDPCPCPHSGLDNYVLNARPQELGVGIGPQLWHELTLAREASRGRAQTEPPPVPPQ